VPQSRSEGRGEEKILDLTGTRTVQNRINGTSTLMEVPSPFSPLFNEGQVSNICDFLLLLVDSVAGNILGYNRLLCSLFSCYHIHHSYSLNHKKYAPRKTIEQLKRTCDMLQQSTDYRIEELTCTFKTIRCLPLYAHSVVGIATDYGLDDRRVGVRVLVGSPRRPDRL
jgi:hypothetical protein